MQTAVTRLPPAENLAVDQMARAQGRTRSEALRVLITEGLRVRQQDHRLNERDRVAGTITTPTARAI
jgi:hypothetical protein